MTTNQVDTDPPRPDLQQLLLWALKALCLTVESTDNGHFVLVLSEEDRGDFAGASRVAFTFHETTVDGDEQPELISLDSRLWRWAVVRLRATGGVVHATPRTQPTGVHQFAQRLFDLYTVHDGIVRLGGCILEDHPLLRFTYRQQTADGPQLVHVYATPSGEAVGADLLESLHLADLAPVPGKPPRVSLDTVAQWLAVSRRLVPAPDNDPPVELLATTVVWCKYAQGKLHFVIDGSEAELPFEGWAQLLGEGIVQPPPYRCEASGRESYHLATTDDGRISVPEAIAICDQSGERVLETDLATCQWSGRRVLVRFLMDCPVTNSRIITKLAVVCEVCRQQVSPQCIRGGVCGACRDLHPVARDDALVARVLSEYPKLDSWGGWRVAESSQVYILTATSLLRRLLVVLDKESLEPLRLADGSRFSRRWTDVPDERWDMTLGE